MTAPVILVVEDDTLLRLSAIMMLEDAGFEALGARDAEEALITLGRRSDIRLVFTDVDMGPGEDGVWLSLQIRNRWPPVQIIVTSGHRDVTADMRPEGAIFFVKPYSEHQVVDEVRRLAA